MELDPRLIASTNDRVHTLPYNDPNTSTTDRPSGSLIPSSRSDGEEGGDGADTPDAPAGLGTTTQYSHDADPDANDPKRPRACEACRGLKVRCEPDPNDEGPCKRCRKAGRSCVVTMPTRKRQKKTDSRVAELEKKIDALTASLQARGPPAAGHASPVTGTPTVKRQNVDTEAPARTLLSTEPSTISWRNSSTDRTWGSVAPTQSPVTVTPGTEHGGLPERVLPTPTTTTAGQKRKCTEDHEDTSESQRAQDSNAETLASYLARGSQGDIVERGLLTMERATELFARYNDHMVPHLPAVVFQPCVTVAELRRTKPTLFLAIMAASTAESPTLQKVLHKELLLAFAEKVMLAGEKSMELVQALQVAVIWYWPPEHFEELKFYQFVHIAAVMAIDIGLGQKVQQRRGKHFADTWQNSKPSRPGSTPLDPMSIESRRAWLTCYFLAANTSMGLHRPNLVRWNPFMDDCMRLLQSSPDAAPSDTYFCHLVWTHHLSEEAGTHFGIEDPTSLVSITDPRVRYGLKGLERDLEQYKDSVSPDLLRRKF